MRKRKETSIKFISFADCSTADLIARGLRIRQVAELDTDPTTLIDNTFFCGGTVMLCSAGKFRLELDGGFGPTLSAGDTLILYPGSLVTIKALEAKNRLHYVIIDEGPCAVDYLNSFSFYDRLVFRTTFPGNTFETIRRALATPDRTPAEANAAAISILSDMLRTFQYDIRRNGNALFYDAINLIHCNLSRGIVRTDPLCRELQTSRSHLHKQFLAHCGVGPGEFIRREQLRIALWYLVNSRRAVKEIATEVGIPSSVYFTIFIRRQTGRTPSEIRRSGIVSLPSDEIDEHGASQGK